MFFTADSASPSGTRTSSWGTCTSTLNPVAVLAAASSAVTLIEGSKFSASQPSSPIDGDVWSRNVYVTGANGNDGLFGPDHEFPVTDDSKASADGSPHEVGSKRTWPAFGRECRCGT